MSFAVTRRLSPPLLMGRFCDSPETLKRRMRIKPPEYRSRCPRTAVEDGTTPRRLDVLANGQCTFSPAIEWIVLRCSKWVGAFSKVPNECRLLSLGLSPNLALDRADSRHCSEGSKHESEFAWEEKRRRSLGLF